MTLYSIFERETPALAAPAAVPEKFSWLAALLPPLFGLLHGLWVETLVFGLAVALLVLASLWLGPAAGLGLYLLLALLIGFEASAIRRAALLRRGWAYRAEFFAPDGDLAQTQWLASRGAAH